MILVINRFMYLVLLVLVSYYQRLKLCTGSGPVRLCELSLSACCTQNLLEHGLGHSEGGTIGLSIGTLI